MHHRHQAALHILGAAPEDPAAVAPGCVALADGNSVDVPVEQQRRPAAQAFEPRVDVGTAGLDFVEGHLEPRPAQQIGEEAAAAALPSGLARNADELQGIAGQGFGVDFHSVSHCSAKPASPPAQTGGFLLC